MADLVLQKRLSRLEAEVLHLLPIYGEVNYDDLGAKWVLIEHFPIGPHWNRPEVKILIDIPSGNPGYPQIAPQWFWTFKELTTRDGKKPEHYFLQNNDPHADAEHLQKGWGHFCIYHDPWNPAPANDLTRGHSLISYLEMISYVFHNQLPPPGR